MDDWEQKLAMQGRRLTGARRAVCIALCHAQAPLEPQQLLELAREGHGQLGLVTVYRTLSLLTELGLVRRVHLENGCHGYLPATQGHHHALICRYCGHSVEFPGREDLEALIANVESSTGYRVEEHLLQLSGLCPTCQQHARHEAQP